VKVKGVKSKVKGVEVVIKKSSTKVLTKVSMTRKILKSEVKLMYTATSWTLVLKK
jgi:hypothetical protein